MDNSRLDSFVRYFDFAKVPVTLKVNRSESYATFAGGLCSLLMILTVAALGVLELLKVFQEPQKFRERVETSYLNMANQTEAYTIPVSDFIPAI